MDGAKVGLKLRLGASIILFRELKKHHQKCTNQSYWFVDCHTITGIKLDYMPKRNFIISCFVFTDIT